VEYYWKFCGTVTQTCGESGESGVDSGAELVLCESGTADPCGGTQSFGITQSLCITQIHYSIDSV